MTRNWLWIWGMVGLVAVPSVAGAANVQVIHNAPNPGASALDVVVYTVSGDSLWAFEDIGFRQATMRRTGLSSGIYLLSIRDGSDPSTTLLTEKRAGARYVRVAIVGSDASVFVARGDGSVDELLGAAPIVSRSWGRLKAAYAFD